MGAEHTCRLTDAGARSGRLAGRWAGYVACGGATGDVVTVAVAGMAAAGAALACAASRMKRFVPHEPFRKTQTSSLFTNTHAHPVAHLDELPPSSWCRWDGVRSSNMPTFSELWLVKLLWWQHMVCLYSRSRTQFWSWSHLFHWRNHVVRWFTKRIKVHW